MLSENIVEKFASSTQALHKEINKKSITISPLAFTLFCQL